MTTKSLIAVIQSVAADLGDAGCPFALVGGLAVSLRAEVRFTRVIDIAVVSDAEAETVIGFLRGRRYTVEPKRPNDLADILSLIDLNPSLDWSTVDANLATITERGFARQQDLAAKLTAIRAVSG